MRTFPIFNMKGGVGKTTTAINLAYNLAVEHGKRVLLVDADAQANATQLLLPRREYDGLGALLSGTACCYAEVIEHTTVTGLDVLPASDSLWAIDLALITSDGHRSFRSLKDLRSALEMDDAYDVMIIDCPPNFSTACIAAINAADSIVIPVLADAFSAEGMANLMRQIDSVKEFNPAVQVGGVLINQWHNADVVIDAANYMRDDPLVPVYQTMIRRTDKVIESTWAKEPVQSWSPFSSAARDFRAWVRELMEKEEMLDGR